MARGGGDADQYPQMGERFRLTGFSEAFGADDGPGRDRSQNEGGQTDDGSEKDPQGEKAGPPSVLLKMEETVARHQPKVCCRGLKKTPKLQNVSPRVRGESNLG